MAFLKVALVPVSFVILIVGWWCVYNLRDVELNPDFGGFFVSDEFNTLNNFHVAWAGIHALERTPDLYAYGAERVEQDSGYVHKRALRFRGLDISMDTFCFNQADYRDGKDCTLSQDFQQLYKVNRTLLTRYRDLYNRRDLQVNVGDRFFIEGTYGQDILLLHRLSILEWIRMAKNGQASDAVDELISSMESVQDVVNGKIAFVDHAIWMIVFEASLDALPIILSADMSVIDQKRDRIEDILGWDYMLVWNVAAMERAEYNLINTALSDEKAQRKLTLKIKDTKNKFYDLSQARVVLSEMSALQLTDDVLASFVLDHDPCYLNSGFSCWGYNATGNRLLEGFVNGGELLQKAHMITAQQRAAVVWMQAKAQDVAPNEMVSFLSKTDPSLYNPFSEQPFLWDDESGSIYFTADDVNLVGSRSDLYL